MFHPPTTPNESRGGSLWRAARERWLDAGRPVRLPVGIEQIDDIPAGLERAPEAADETQEAA